MKKLRFLPFSSALGTSLVLFAVLLAACAPATSTAAPVKPVLERSLTPSSVPAVAATPTAPLSTAASSDVQPVATSRGPNLEATDPTTVNLASGGLQLVEFFRFT